MLKNIYSIIGIVFAMLLLPITTITGNSLLIWGVLICYILWMVVSNKHGYSMILVAICLCQSSVTNENLDSSYINNLFAYFYYVLLFIPLLIFVILYIKGYKIPFKEPIGLSIVFIIIGLIYGLHIVQIIYIIVVTHIAFLIGYFDNLDEDSMFRLYSLTILISAIYAGLEYYLGVSPYLMISYNTNEYLYSSFIKRASGLLGNPLILLLIVIFYQAIICYRAIKIGKIPIIPQLLALFLSLIVVSRSAVLSIIVFFILYLIYSKSKFSLKQITYLSVFVILTGLTITNFMGDTFNDLSYRLANSDKLHRQSSFSVTTNILQDNIFGVGFDNFANSLYRYAAIGTNVNVNTLDNFFLSQLAHYGIIGLFVIYFYLYYFILYIKKKKYYSLNKELFFLLVAFFISAIMFDFEAYHHVSFIIYTLIGGAFARLHKNQKTNFINSLSSKNS